MEMVKKYLRMEINLKGNIGMENPMDMVNISGAMRIIIRDNSPMVWEMEKGVGKVRSEEKLIDIKDFMLMIKRMEKVYLIMQMGLFMKAISKMIRDVVMVRWFGQTEQHIKVIGIII